MKRMGGKIKGVLGVLDEVEVLGFLQGKARIRERKRVVWG